MRSLINQLVVDALGTHIGIVQKANAADLGQAADNDDDDAPFPGARLAPDGHHYVQHPGMPGKFFRVVM
jgi:hypothetical protein